MADSMSFEYLLRRIYQVGRYGKRDVDADVYRRLERAERHYILETENIKNKQPRISIQSIDDIDYEYRVECRKVWSIIKTAIQKGITENRDKFSIDEIEKMEDSIIEPRIVLKEHIDNTIDTVEKIYVSHKIYPK